MNDSLAPNNELENTLAVIMQPGNVYELRMLKTKHGTISGYFNNSASLAKIAAQYNSKVTALYLTLNPVNPALLARANNTIKERAENTTSDNDVIRRVWLLVDLDAVRPPGISSTDNEHLAAVERAWKVSEWLELQGVSKESMVIADSGNGAHILIRLDLPNDKTSTLLCQNFLKALDLVFTDATVEIDQTTYNAARIGKLYGTLVMKGDSIPERSHRYAKLLQVPEKITPVDISILQGIAENLPKQTEPEHFAGNGHVIDVEKWLRHYNLEVSRVADWHGGKKYILKQCPFNPEHDRGEALVIQFASGAMFFKCLHNSCNAYDWKALRNKYPINYVNNNDSLINMPPKVVDEAKSEQTPEQVGTSHDKEWGKYSERFDEIMRGAGGGWQDKGDVAEQLGIKATDRAFRSLLQRRREDGNIRVHSSRPSLIQWVNRDYKITSLSGHEKQIFLDIKLALRLHEVVRIPPGSVIAVAGYTSAGKTAFMLETAELNALSQTKPVYYWYNEMSEERMVNRSADFPKLIQGQQEGKFFPVKQGDFEFCDVLEPDGINFIDYIDRDSDLFLIGQDIKQLQSRLSTGIIIFGLQKPAERDFGYGGLSSAKLSNLYIALDKKSQTDTTMVGEAQIIKSKDWVKFNPVGLRCSYHTGGQYGKLFMDGDWYRR